MRVDRIAFVTAMAQRDLTVKRIAELSGLSRVTVTNVKGGKSCSQSTADKLASVLGSNIISSGGKRK